VKVDRMLMEVRPAFDGPGVEHPAVASERLGYDGVWVAEKAHDPFLALLPAAQATERVEIGTAVAVAFARSPMILAQVAHDLQAYSAGRFVLGLGSQIRPHITRRYSMPWSDHPAAQMRELVAALRAIWACWNDGEPLDFRGEHYTHTLMTPFFSPGPNPYGPPKVMLAGVGPHMTRVAGEVADGFLAHGFTTERFFREVTWPALEAGLARAGRARESFEVAAPSFVVTGTDEEETAAAADRVRRQIAFYGSTPAYRPVLDVHGWGDLQTELRELTRDGRWDDMPALIDDEILGTFAVVAEPERIAGAWAARWGGLVDRLSFYVPHRGDPERWARVLDDLRSLPATAGAA